MNLKNRTVRLFIGTSANGEDADAEMAYEYTLRKNTSRDLEIVWMRKSHTGFWSGWNDSAWSTPFSGFRWGIPEFCRFKGRAIYTDVDMLNFEDIGNLFDLPIPDHNAMLARNGKRFGGKEFCVILFDCERCGEYPNFQQAFTRGRAPRFHHSMIDLAQNLAIVGDLDPKWNSHDGDVRPFSQLHFTNMATQPWRPSWFTGEPKEHPDQDLVDIFWKTHSAALMAGYDLLDYVPNPNQPIEYGIIGK